MEMIEACPDTFNEGYIHQFQPESTHKIHEQQQKHIFQRYPPMGHLSNNPKDCPNQHENTHKQCNEMRHPIVHTKLETYYKKPLWPLFMDGVQLPQGYSHFKDTVYFLPPSSQKFLVLILSSSEG